MLELTTRRHFFQTSASGVGAAALSGLLAGRSFADARAGAHFPARARSVIYLHMVGAPSHLDLFAPKPKLAEMSGKLCPDEFFVGKRLAFIRKQPRLLGTPRKDEFGFRRCGGSDVEISNQLPNLQRVGDRLSMIHTLHTEQFNHAPAQLFLLTGFPRFGRPSIGSWLSYGLGSENRDLPDFVVLVTGQVLGAGNSAWGSGFLPTVHQGVEFRSSGDPVLFLSNPKGVDESSRRSVLDTVRKLNAAKLADVGDPEIATRIEQYELGYRMQTSVPELMDIASEPSDTLDLYGAKPGKASFANNCLLARRLVERGVRFVQLFDQGWDHHGSVFGNLPGKCRQVDRPIAALLEDLARRGLLDETLVVWSAEFGRTPMAQGTSGTGNDQRAGRDHHKEAYSVWLAGGGTKRGYVHGSTDELGYGVAEKGVSVHDLNATILHLLGIDHERLTFRYQGRQFRLTDVHGEVIHDLLA